MSDTRSLCFLCGKDTKYLAADQKLSDTYNVRCDRCGQYKITWEALQVVTPEQKFRLSAFCRRAGKSIPPPMIRSDNIEKLLESIPVFGPLEKLDNLLLLFGERTSKLGGNALLNEELDAALLICHEDEIAFLKETLWTDGFIQNKNAGTQVTMKGWERIQQIQKSGRDSKRAFVAMWFDPSMDEVYDKAIAPAISRAGYLPLRIDRHPHVIGGAGEGVEDGLDTRSSHLENCAAAQTAAAGRTARTCCSVDIAGTVPEKSGIRRCSVCSAAKAVHNVELFPQRVVPKHAALAVTSAARGRAIEVVRIVADQAPVGVTAVAEDEAVEEITSSVRGHFENRAKSVGAAAERGAVKGA